MHGLIDTLKTRNIITCCSRGRQDTIIFINVLKNVADEIPTKNSGSVEEILKYQALQIAKIQQTKRTFR